MVVDDDDAVTLDESGITAKNHHLPGRPRTIRYDDIVDAELIGQIRDLDHS